jgi:hypothetical protein
MVDVTGSLNAVRNVQWFVESVKGCFARPEFIGWHICGIIDSWKTFPPKRRFQHQGLMTVKGAFYPEMEEAVKEISSSMFRIAGLDER